jgi:hypothetical protein
MGNRASASKEERAETVSTVTHTAAKQLDAFEQSAAAAAAATRVASLGGRAAAGSTALVAAQHNNTPRHSVMRRMLARAKELLARGDKPLIKDELCHAIILIRAGKRKAVHEHDYEQLSRLGVDVLHATLRAEMYTPDILLIGNASDAPLLKLAPAAPAPAPLLALEN